MKEQRRGGRVRQSELLHSDAAWAVHADGLRAIVIAIWTAARKSGPGTNAWRLRSFHGNRALKGTRQ